MISTDGMTPWIAASVLSEYTGPVHVRESPGCIAVSHIVNPDSLSTMGLGLLGVLGRSTGVNKGKLFVVIAPRTRATVYWFEGPVNGRLRVSENSAKRPCTPLAVAPLSLEMEATIFVS